MIRKRNKNFTLIFFLALLVASCGASYEKSQTVTDVLDSDPQGMKALYFYPSTMRMLSEIMGTENTEALNGIREARLLFRWNDVNSSFESHISEIERGIQTENFEPLFQMNSQGADVEIFIRDSQIPVYLIFYSDAEYDFALEAVGELSQDAIRSLATTDMSGLMDLFGAGSEEPFIEEEDTNSEIKRNE